MAITAPTTPIVSPRDPVAVLDASTASVLTLPTGFSVFNVTFARDGNDLVVTAPDGRWVLIKDFFAIVPPPDLADAAGGLLSGAIVDFQVASSGGLTPEELERIAGFETAAGGRDEATDDGFATDAMPVTLGFDPLADGGPAAGLADVAMSFGAQAGDRSGVGNDGHSLVLVIPTASAPAPSPPPPSRIALLDSQAFSHLSGVRFEALLPIAGNLPRLFYEINAPYHEDHGSVDGAPRRFQPTDPDGMLLMSTGLITSEGSDGGTGSRAFDILAFADPTGSASFAADLAAKTGSVIRAQVNVAPGSILLADILFDPDNFESLNDFAFLVVDGEVFTLADVDGTAGGATGWRTVAVQNPDDGIGRIAFGVMNAETDDNQSFLLIDNIRAQPGTLAGGVGEVLGIGARDFQVFWSQEAATSATTVSMLLPPLIAVNDALTAYEDEIADSGIRSLLDNDLAPPVGFEVDGTPVVMPLTIIAVNGDAGNVGREIDLTAASGAPGGRLTVNADGTWKYDPAGTFNALNSGQTATVRFDYTVAAANEAVDTATATITVRGVGGPGDVAALIPRTTVLDATAWSQLAGIRWEALLPNPANPPFLFYQTNASVHVERDLIGAADRRFLPTDGNGMLLLAAGSFASPGLEGGLQGSNAADILTFADPTGAAGFGAGVDAADGSVVRAAVSVAPGRTLVLDVLFDPVATTENDFAFMVVDGDLFRLADVFGAADGVIGWQTIAVANATDGVSRIAFGVMNADDTVNDPYLAIDNIRVLNSALDGAAGDRVNVGGEPLQVIELATGIVDPATEVRTLARVPVATDDAYVVGENGRLDTTADPALSGLLDNDHPPSPSFVTVGGADLPLPLSVVAVNGLSDAVGAALPLERPSGEPGGLLTVRADGSFVFDPNGRFGDLNAGEMETLSFDYTVATSTGGSDTATASITVTGEGGPTVLADFETGALPGLKSGSVAIVAGAQSGGFQAEPVSGAAMLKLGSEGVSLASIQSFLGLGSTFALRDPVDNSQAVRGSAFTLDATLRAGDTVSFHWWFDNAELVTAKAAGFNDFALFRAGNDVFRFVDGRMQHTLTGQLAGHLESFWTQWTAPESGNVALQWAVFDDNMAVRPATLLIDLVQVNAPVPDGYSIVAESADGALATFAAPGFA